MAKQRYSCELRTYSLPSRGLLFTPVQARADDAVMEWNQIAFAATVTAGQGPVPQIRSMAIVHVAVHDAVNAITCRNRTYLSITCGPWGSPEAATIGAAYRALVGLFPSQATALTQRATRRWPRADSPTQSWRRVRRCRRGGAPAVRATDGAAQAQFPYTAPDAGSPGVWVAVGTAPPVTPGWGRCQPLGPAKPLAIRT